MKTFALICAACACLAATAREVVVGSQPASTFPDAEASTNVAISVARSDAWAFDVRIDLDCCESNCVQVAFGFDADGDGDLAFDETDLALGWRSGRCFVEDVAGGARHFDEADSVLEGNRFLHMRVVTDREYVPKFASFASDAGQCFADVAAESPPWLFRTNWNLLKVTRRGVVPSNEICRIDRISRSFHLIVR